MPSQGLGGPLCKPGVGAGAPQGLGILPVPSICSARCGKSPQSQPKGSAAHVSPGHLPSVWSRKPQHREPKDLPCSNAGHTSPASRAKFCPFGRGDRHAVTSICHLHRYNVIQRAGIDSFINLCHPGTVGWVTSDLSKPQASPPLRAPLTLICPLSSLIS